MTKDTMHDVQAAVAAVNESAAALRDAVIRNLAASGLSSKEIAEGFGLTRGRVNQIVKPRSQA